MCSYLKNRRGAVQINIIFSSYKKVQAGVLQGSIDVPLLFKLFINDLVLFVSEIFLSNYAVDNDLCSIGKELNLIKEKLQKDFNPSCPGLFWSCVAPGGTHCVPRFLNSGRVEL